LKLVFEIKKSINIINKSPNIIRIFVFLIFLSFFINSFIKVTTNRLFNNEIRELLLPYHLTTLVIILISSVILFIYFFRENKLTEYVVAGSTILFLSCLILGIYGFSPCLFIHTDSFSDHIHPHTNSYILKQSFLCPTYSITGYLYLLFCGVVGVLALLISILYNTNIKKYK